MKLHNSSHSIFWLSDHEQNNWRRGSGETIIILNDIFLFLRSLVFSCFVHGRSTRVSKVSYSLVSLSSLNQNKKYYSLALLWDLLFQTSSKYLSDCSWVAALQGLGLGRSLGPSFFPPLLLPPPFPLKGRYAGCLNATLLTQIIHFIAFWNKIFLLPALL